MNGDIEIQKNVWSNIDEKKREKAYNYDEAIALAGNGCYNLSLMVTLSLVLLAMCIDLFSFSLVVTFSSCDFHLDLAKKSILVSMPFAGPIVTAYIWGYISDTRGRKKSLIMGMSGSFVMSILCAFAPNWIALAIFKLIGTSLSSCAQSATYALIGESCAVRVKSSYMFIMTSVIHATMLIYFTLGYFIGPLSFSYDLGFITFVSWRLLVLVLGLPLGFSAFFLIFFYESPKFLLNADREDEALNVLRQICRRNGNEVEKYPVQRLVLTEDGNVQRKNVPILKSMWEQVAPLFKPPLLKTTLLLYYLIFVIYSSSSSFYVWLPFIAEAFSKEDLSGGHDQSLCGMIVINANNTGEILDNIQLLFYHIRLPTTLRVDLFFKVIPYKTLWLSEEGMMAMETSSWVFGVITCTVNFLMSKLASRRRGLMIAICIFTGASCATTMFTPNNVSTVFYFGVLWTSMTGGPLFSYYVDLYPTSFRGMAACLGVMASRVSSVIGINVVGPLMLSHCNFTFYGLSALLFSGAAMSCLLPLDGKKKEVTVIDR